MKPLVVFKTVSFPTFSETFIVSNIAEAVKMGYEVKIIVDIINSKTNTSQSELLEKYKLMDKVSRMKHPITQKERKIKAMSLLCNPVLLYYFVKYSLFKKKKSLSYIFTLNFYLKFRKAKVYHVHFATAINPLLELKKIGFLKAKIVVTFHGHDSHFLPEQERLNNMINDFSKYVSDVTVNSEFLKKKLVDKGFKADNIKIIPIGIDTRFFNDNTVKKKDSRSFKILTVGRLIELKGQAFGIRIAKLLIDKGYKIDYTLVGFGDELEQLKQLVVELDLEDNVCFYGIGTQNEIKELLRENDLFLMTSTSDRFDRCEAFGVVSLEAQAMGVPVVGFKSGGFVETIIEGKTGVTVEDKDCIAMANAIEKLILNNNLLMTMSENAKKHILSTYIFENTTGQYLKLYK